MKLIIRSVVIIFFSYTINLLAGDNNGRIVGKILDASGGGVLPDAVIKVENTPKGAASDLDGKYEINDLKAGMYTLKASYIGYIAKTVNVEVKPGETVTVDFVLQSSSSSMDTITVQAERRFNNESSLLLQRQNSERISDGISEQQIKRAPDALASDVMKRITGISIVSDKFINIRGISERYSNANLNGIQLPSGEPDKKAFSFDLFPSNLLENVVVSKSFTPDQQGNFSGGLVEITTKDIPDAFTYSLSTSSSFMTGTTTENNFLTYNAAQSRVLGINLGKDDGGRNMPSNFPDNSLISSNFSKDQIISFSKEFRNNWGQQKVKAPLNGGFQLSVGDKINLFKNPLGFFAAYTYRNSFSSKNVLLEGFDQDNNLLSDLTGQISTYKVLWGALLNLTYKVGDNTKLSVKNSYVQDGEDATQYLKGYVPDWQKKLYSTDFKERTLRSIQITGDHYIHSLAKLRFSWAASYSDTRRNEPDYKTLAYQRDPTNYDDPNYYATITTGSLTFDGGSRFFSKLLDISRTAKADFEVPLKIKNQNLKVKAGTLVAATRRSFDARLFAPVFFNYTNVFTQLYITKLPPDSIFMPVNFRDSALYYSEYTRATDTYNAKDNLYAGYMMFDLQLFKFKLITGARLESYEQKLNSLGYSSTPLNVSLKNNDILPAVNLIYLLNDKTNIRASYYQTVSRPEFRELAPFGFTDFTTRDFVSGNPDDLHRTLIRNYDLRFELFPRGLGGEVASLSLFYKKIDAPIEEVKKLTSGNPLRTFENAESGAVNYGAELEVRKNFGFISKDLSGLSFSGNLALIKSKIKLNGTGSLDTRTERPMEGQAPYIINIGLFYDNAELGTSVNLMYNRIGDRIAEVGLAGFSDTKEAGRDVVDFSISQRILKNFETKFTVKNLLNQDIKYFETSSDKEYVTRRYTSGIDYGLTVSYKY